MESILLNLREYIGDTEVILEYVDEIPLVRTGKRSPVMSTVREDFQNLNVSGQVRHRSEK
jgi:hypothetical protein